MPLCVASAASASFAAERQSLNALSYAELILLVPCSSVYFFCEPSVTVVRWIYPLNLVINRDFT